VHDIGSQPNSEPNQPRTKQAVRSQILARRAAMADEERAAAARATRDALLERPELEMAAGIAAYVAIGTEPPTSSLIFALWKRGAYVLLPRLLPDRDLEWATYEGPDSLVPGPYGLLQPTAPTRGVDGIKGADVVIVPALAVDHRGVRLGRGGGSYDRALARVGPAILTVTMLYDGEILDELPAEPHDQKVSAAVTPSGGFVTFPQR
jgi:5-formyltetrahydrofolate cyclo-ligase